MTRTPSGVSWRAASAALALCGLLAVGTTPAFADDQDPLRLPPAGEAVKESPDSGYDPLSLLRADPREDGAPVRHDVSRPGFTARVGAAGGSISGKVTYTDITTEPVLPLGTGYVEVQIWDDATQEYLPVGGASTASDGTYTVGEVPAGTYLVAFWDNVDSGLMGEFWKDAPISGWATEVVLADGEARTGVDETLEPMLTGYIAGADRYATSVAISKFGFEPDVNCVYIASGANFPDALSAGPAAAKCGGPLLLVAPNAIPTLVAEELRRLNPSEIVIAGGTGAVSSSVQTQLGAYGNVRRIAGSDRYDTSRKIVADAWDTTPVVWVATGTNFPDALAASAAAAIDAYPVMIVPGRTSALDAPSRALLNAIDPEVIAIAGGTGVVTTGMESSLYWDVATVEGVARFGGASRYDTAYLINSTIWDPTAAWAVYAWMVNGTKFPDALSGAALAGYFGGPMHVVPPTCTPANVASNITDLAVWETKLLGYFGQLSFNGQPFKIC